MREWNLTAGDPLCLTLAADARLSSPDYANDHIWEINLTGCEPPALNLQTTFGLRASWLRLFPRFARGTAALTDPASFARTPRLVQFYPNYLAFSFSPFQGIDVFCEYWVPASQVIAGRFQIENKNAEKEQLRFELAALLSPLSKGESMSPLQSGPGHVLAGATEDLFPVCAATGAAQPVHSPFPALAFDLELFPGANRQITWALASLGKLEDSLELARKTLSSAWEAEVARIAMINQQQSVEIFTGDPDWDAALAFSQKTAFSLFFSAGKHLPNPSFVLSRNPDQGYSPRGDGSDYSFPWSGQSGMNSYYLASLMLPGAADLAEGLLKNFLIVQNEDGSIDWKPGMSGQRGLHLCQPVLASLACLIDRYKNGSPWLEEVYPPLLAFFKAWLSPQHDRDGDGFPEWDHPLQTGYEDNPLFDRWHPQSQGVDITTLESPALASMLYRECASLIKIAKKLNRVDDLSWLEDQFEKLRQAVESCWDNSAATYRFRDYQTHAWSSGRSIKSFQGSGSFDFAHNFSVESRLLLRLHTADESTRAARVIITGASSEGPVSEEVQPGQIYWVRGDGRYTTQHVFTSIERVEVQGMNPKDRLRLTTIDTNQETLPLLLPLWAGISDPERARALVERTILGRYLTAFGLPMCPPGSYPEEVPYMASVQMVWNQFIGEGLLASGRRAEAADLVSRLMSAVITTLKQQQSFRQFYLPGGSPSGDRNSLTGLAPVGLFLQTLGIDQLTPNEMILSGFNPFPWPITVKYRGVTVVRQQQSTLVSFPSGQSATLDGPGPYRLSLT